MKKEFFLKAAIIDNEVVCQYGKQVVLTISCDVRDRQFCLNPKERCIKLQNIFAKNLYLFRFAVVERREEKVLNCFYDDAK